MKKIMIIDRGELGTLTDTLKYCEYLHNEYNITYICFDEKQEKIIIPNTKTLYVPKKGNKLLRGILFLCVCIMCCLFYNGFIFIVYFPHCEWLKKILFWKKMHVDIRTLSVNKSEIIQEEENKRLENSINKFDSISFITEGIKKKVHVKDNIQTFILPLGADIISTTNKDFKNIKLLYIGTLSNRNILDTVVGLKMFNDKYPQIPIKYSLIGDGTEYEIIKKYVKENNLEDIVSLYGRLPYNKLKPYLDTHNIGISYVPLIDCYEFQPPTKTFEYGLSGLYIIATETYENKQVINDKNGILIRDSSEDFVNALYKIYSHRNEYNSNVIRNTMEKFQWKNIINKYLIKIIS